MFAVIVVSLMLFTVIAFGAPVGGYMYYTYAEGKHAEFSILAIKHFGDIGNLITEMNDELDAYKVQRDTLAENFKMLIMKIESEHNQLNLDWEKLDAVKYDVKLMEDEWLVKVLGDTSSRTNKFNLKQYYLRKDLMKLIQDRSKLNDNFRSLVNSFNEIRSILRRHFDKIVSASTYLGQLKSWLLHFVLSRLDDDLEKIFVKLMDFVRVLFRDDNLKYEVVKAGTEYAKAFHHFNRRTEELNYRIHSSPCFNTRSSSLQDYVFMLHGDYGNTCEFQESEPDYFVNPWGHMDYYLQDNRFVSFGFLTGLKKYSQLANLKKEAH